MRQGLAALLLLAVVACSPAREPPPQAASPAAYCHPYVMWRDATDEVVALLDTYGDNPDLWPESALGAWTIVTSRQLAAADLFHAIAPAELTLWTVRDECD